MDNNSFEKIFYLEKMKDCSTDFQMNFYLNGKNCLIYSFIVLF